MALGRTVRTKRGKGGVEVDIVNDIPKAMKELTTLADKSDTEWLIKAAIGTCETAAGKQGGAPIAKKSGVLGAAYAPSKGGKSGKTASHYKGRMFYAILSQPGRRGTPRTVAETGTKKVPGWNKRRSSIGYGKAGFLGAREHVAKIARKKGVKVKKTRGLSNKNIEAARSSDAYGDFVMAIRKSITVVNATSSAKANEQHSAYQKAVERGLAIWATLYIHTLRKIRAKECKKVSAK